MLSSVCVCVRVRVYCERLTPSISQQCVYCVFSDVKDALGHKCPGCNENVISIVLPTRGQALGNISTIDWIRVDMNWALHSIKAEKGVSLCYCQWAYAGEPTWVEEDSLMAEPAYQRWRIEHPIRPENGSIIEGENVPGYDVADERRQPVPPQEPLSTAAVVDFDMSSAELATLQQTSALPAANPSSQPQAVAQQQEIAPPTLSGANAHLRAKCLRYLSKRQHAMPDATSTLRDVVDEYAKLYAREHVQRNAQGKMY